MPEIDAYKVVEALTQVHPTHVVWLPDSETRFMYEALTAQRDLTLVPVCREAETMAVATGLWAGGKKPIVLIQNTGLMESGDSIRGLCLDIGFPLLMVVGYRGWKEPGVQRIDSAAVYTEPILNAWGIKYYLVEGDHHVGRIVEAHREAERTSRPVAALVCSEYSARRAAGLVQERPVTPRR